MLFGRSLESEIQLRELERQNLQELLEDRAANTDEIEKQIDAMRKRTLELRIQAETFGMAAGAEPNQALASTLENLFGKSTLENLFDKK